MQDIINQVQEQLALLHQSQQSELNALLEYDIVEIITGEGGTGADLGELATALNGIQYLEDQEALYDAINTTGSTVAISDSPNKSRVKRPGSNQ
jgi:hypothetical protein